ncbi:MAG: choice-of-anchor I family protein [Bacteroidetes bacterium]|nr:choice-of-anchor I family protein [Bacteroidota bacterium]
MKKKSMRRFQLFAFLLLCSTLAQAQGLPIYKIYRFHSGNFNQGGAEHHAFDPLSKRLFSSNAAQAQFDILRIADLSKAGPIASIDLSAYGDRVNSIAVQGNNVAVAVQASFAQSDGKVLFFDTNGTYINQLVVGPKPKMLSFSPSLQHLVVANEGIPSDDYSIDPAGTVSIINFSSGRADNLSQADVQTVSFARYDTLPFDPKVLILGDNGNASFSEDVEPEHLAFNDAGNKVYVSLQENNALAIIDLQTASLDTVVGLGYKDYNLPGMGLDASDQSSSIKIENHFNLFGLYQPKAISYHSDASGSYILSANEGESRNYSAFTDNERINNVNLNPIVFNSPSTLQNDTVLGRLRINTGIGNYNNPFIYDSLFTFGSRSFSIWNTSGQLIWDSGDEFEQTLSSLEAMNFNSSATSNNSFKISSPEKGAEPKAICTGTYGGSNYAFIALEQMGGIMIYNIDNPAAPVFDSYLLDRDFSVAASDSAAGDLGPEFMSYIKASDSPSGLPLLLVSNGVSGTLTIYQIGSGLSLNEEQWEALQAYPNPTSGPLSLSTKSSFKLYNSQGQYLGSFKNRDHIDLSVYAKGYYFLKSEDGASLRVLKN